MTGSYAASNTGIMNLHILHQLSATQCQIRHFDKFRSITASETPEKLFNMTMPGYIIQL